MGLLLLAVLYPIARTARWPYHYMVSGDMFTHRFDARYDIGALDQPGLQDGYFIFTALSVFAFPLIVLARFLSDRRTRFGYWAVLLPVLAIAIGLIIVFVPALYLMCQYIGTMGVTRLRVAGLLYALFGIAAVLATVYWVAIPVKSPSSPFLQTNPPNEPEYEKGPKPEGSGPLK